MTNYVINGEQIQQIITTLDNVAKSEGLSLMGAQTIIEQIIKPITQLPQVNLNTQKEEEKSDE